MIKKHAIMACIGFLTVHMLYKSIVVSIAGAVIFIIVGAANKKEAKRKRDGVITNRFLDFLICLEPLLKSSQTFSRSFSEAVTDYSYIYGKDSIYGCLNKAVKEFKINASTSTALEKAALEMDIEDAYLFAGSISVCEAMGGNIVEVTKKTAELLSGKILIGQEIDIVIAEKKFEQKIITIMPFVLLMIFSITSKSYLTPMYESIIGRVIMSVAGLMFVGEWFICKKIMEIGV